MDLPHDIAGSGPTLVLVHGIVHRRQAWNVLLDQLTPYRRVVTVDLPGHGESAALDDGADTMDHLLDEVSAFVRSVTPAGERAHVAGNSLGGWLALALAARGEVASATALSPAGFFVNRADQARTIYTFRALRGVTRALGSNAPRALGYRAVRYPSLAAFFARPSRVRYEDAVVDAHSLATNTLVDKGMTATFDLPRVVDATVPVTVAWGRRDLILPVYQARRVRRSFPQARILVLPGIGHVPMTDDPNLIGTILLGGSSSGVADTPS
ncbi:MULTISPECIES: alpha/beta fold hydrolase [unclassified Rhodococcus (in: high G+C Gram-positive bacteria)]|uniref:alpha/beta fold hydrolase n=1 Tax=unclassified Rhodococcus (in: high G+C Gram-positive bacteria) TaxID=192944 RepID=UPI001639782E|nr:MULTISPECIES: alpha/beta fold hydrolase [unclassified Rhodococcus (in: high G+C Gram-positive bacteria)]MBC2638633.1 alpha/beta fold hydrolase [Rhodococcus sp. 3A]MBC2896626.1 alpha/beta fold hydrolase [Rhodococcus sp. 4CII]